MVTTSKILIPKTWMTNIGNDFIDKGTKSSLQRAYPGAEIIEGSGYTNFAAGMTTIADLVGSVLESAEALLSNRDAAPSLSDDFVNVGELIYIDVAVLSGCVLYGQ